jgi:hypothetical protein
LKGEFQKLGAVAGNLQEGSFTQNVPLVKVAPTFLSSVELKSDSASVFTDIKVSFTSESDLLSPKKRSVLKLDSPLQFVASTSRTDTTKLSVSNSELVFVGYGIHSTEWDWDDFAGLPKDLSGKSLVCLVNDPGFATGDSSLFRGSTMTYEGRWTYKYEEAGRRNADAIFIIHTTEAAGYPWRYISSFWPISRAHRFSEPDISLLPASSLLVAWNPA